MHCKGQARGIATETPGVSRTHFQKKIEFPMFEVETYDSMVGKYKSELCTFGVAILAWVLTRFNISSMRLRIRAKLSADSSAAPVDTPAPPASSGDVCWVGIGLAKSFQVQF